MKKDDIERLTLTTADVMAMTGMGRDRIRMLVKTGQLPNIGGRRILIPRQALTRFLEDSSNAQERKR